MSRLKLYIICMCIYLKKMMMKKKKRVQRQSLLNVIKKEEAKRKEMTGQTKVNWPEENQINNFFGWALTHFRTKRCTQSIFVRNWRVFSLLKESSCVERILEFQKKQKKLLYANRNVYTMRYTMYINYVDVIEFIISVL